MNSCFRIENGLLFFKDFVLPDRYYSRGVIKNEVCASPLRSVQYIYIYIYIYTYIYIYIRFVGPIGQRRVRSSIRGLGDALARLEPDLKHLAASESLEGQLLAAGARAREE